MARRWRWRLVAAALTWGILLLVFSWARFEPDPLRLGLLVVLMAAATGLVLDSTGSTAISWAVTPVRATALAWEDPRTARLLRMLEAHGTARAPDAALRDRLAELVDLALLQRHDLRREDPAAADLLDPRLLRLLDEPPRRLSRAEIDEHLTRIEDL